MKPLAGTWRAPRWLLAAGMALSTALIPLAVAGPAAAQTPELREIAPEGPDGPRLDIEPLEPAPSSDKLVPFFYKRGIQLDCDTVQYRLRFGVRGDAEIISGPAAALVLDAVTFDLKDQIPANLKITDVQISGDLTGPGGGPLPAHILSTSATPDDTMALNGFRLSPNDLDGDGSPTQRYGHVIITAKIDQSAFPAVTNVSNQAEITIRRTDGAVLGVIPSHNPELPDDGDWKTGDATRIVIDVTECTPPPPPPPPGDRPEEACFKVETGEVDCVEGGGAYIYRMDVGPEMAGRVVAVMSTTPGVTIDPPNQLVPAGGGELEWEITGAAPGDTVHLVVTGIETYAGPAEGVGLCCSQTVDIEIPEDLECPPEDDGEPDIKVEKRADESLCEIDGPCDFTIRVSNAGDAPYTGKIVLDEVTGPGSATVISGPNAPWSCAPMTSPMSCEHPETTLNPGEFVELKLGFQPGAEWSWGAIRNCAAFDYTASGHDAPFGILTNDRACAVIAICLPGGSDCTPPEDKTPDIGVRKRADPAQCTPDGFCTYVITVYNAGLDTIDGPVSFVDTFPAGDVASATFSPMPPWNCSALSGNSFQCDHPGLTLIPGGATDILVQVVASDYPTDVVENCAKVTPLPGETNLENNEACAKATIPGIQDGEPALRIHKTCENAVSNGAVACRITITNGGSSAPMGPVRVNDAAEIIGSGSPVDIASVTPDGPEWTCDPAPTASLGCQIPGAVMTPGTSRHFDVTVNVSTGERFENCARGSFGPAPGDDIVYPFGESCAEGGTRITVEKTGDAQCLLGEPCAFEVTIRNEGPSDISGPVRIGDALTVEGFGNVPAEIVSVEPPFGCTPEPAALPFVCEADLTLAAGESRTHVVTVELPAEGGLANEVGNGAEGRNCAAVVPPQADVRAMSMVPGAAANGDERPFDCHEFRVLAEDEGPDVQCSPGLVFNGDGRCVCPEGTSFRNGQCVGTSTVPLPTPRPPVDPRPERPDRPQPEAQCRLLPGQIRTRDGQCVCPRGTRLVAGACRKPEVQRECPQGTTGRYPDCRPIVRPVCPPGTTGRPPNCRPVVQQCRLLPGQIRTRDGQCVCPRGTRLVAGACRKPEVQRECPRGTTGRYPNCRPIVQQCRLLPGQIRTKDGRCVCPRGTRLVAGACRKPEVQRECPRGTVGKFPNCRPIVRPTCPPGTVGRPPNCRKVNVAPQRVTPQLLRPRDTNRIQ